MVKGLDVFQEHFAGYSEQFILIGGTAATLTMEQAGFDFRATKDLDIVLHIEALKPAFGTTFWTFIEKGGYHVREASDTGKPVLYRFQKPADTRYPFMLAGRRAGSGLTWIGEDRLIPLKAHAWLDLSARKERGELIDSKNIRKHGNDVIRLSQLLSPDLRIPVPPGVTTDLNRFLQRLVADGTYSPASIGLGNSLGEIVRRISQAYETAPG
jgi:hypothetical protein